MQTVPPTSSPAPTPASPINTPPPSVPPTREPSNTRWLILAGIIIVGGAVGLYALSNSAVFTGLNKNLKQQTTATKVAIRPADAEILLKSLETVNAAKSFDITYATEETKPGNAKTISTLLVDRFDTAHAKMQFTFEGTPTSKNPNTTTQSYDMIFAEGKSYLRLKSFPHIFLFATNMENQWVDFTSVQEHISQNIVLSEANVQALLNSLVEKKIIEITAQLQDDVIAGVPAYHYTYVYHNDRIAEAESQLKAFFGNTKNTEKATKQTEKILKGIVLQNGELWVAASTLEPLKISAQEETKNEQGSTLSSQNITVTFSKRNEPTNISIPRDAKKYEAVVDQNFKTFFNALLAQFPSPIKGETK